MASNINRVIVTGNLTRDPELREVGSTSVCQLRVAVNSRRKGTDGQWEDKPNYFDAVVWGQHGSVCAQYLTKGSGVAIDGRLDWREWESEQGKRQAVQIIADSVQFLRVPDDAAPARPAQQTGSDVHIDMTDLAPPAPAAVQASTDDIPF
jgi:single-strand DNA-binding protein